MSIVIHELRGSPSSVQDPAQLGTVGARRFRPLPELDLCWEKPGWRAPGAPLWANLFLNVENYLNCPMETIPQKIHRIGRAHGRW